MFQITRQIFGKNDFYKNLYIKPLLQDRNIQYNVQKIARGGFLWMSF